MARPEYVEVRCKNALNRVTGMPFRWSANPYTGCRHSCVYCYAVQYYAQADHGSAADFSERILVKTNFAEALRRQLANRSMRGETVALGTATDPYQPVEGRYRITRAVLETLVDFRQPLNIVTKSPLVWRDTDLLAALAKRAEVHVWLTITTVDLHLWRTVEPGTANPFKRLQAMQRLVQAGVSAGVLLAPVLPGLTDSMESIDAVIKASTAHGAAGFGSSALRLNPVVREHYLKFIERVFPDLLPRYQHAYRGVNAPMEYQRLLKQRVARILAVHGFVRERHPTAARPLPVPPVQLRLLE